MDIGINFGYMTLARETQKNKGEGER